MIILLIMVFFISCNYNENKNKTEIYSEKRIIKSDDYRISVKLPNNVILRSISADSVEYHIVKWLDDDSKIVNKTTWFNFDKFLFQKGVTTLINGSGQQLSNLCEIMKAYPDVTIKLGSYTDNSELNTTEKRMKLSTDRAIVIKNQLIKLGINASRIVHEGYGEQWPLVSNETEEGKQKNRRIAIRITKKL